MSFKKIYSFMGSKSRFLSDINRLIDKIFFNIKTEDYIYVEPFLGSGVVFLNLERKFGEYDLNDNREDLLLFFEYYKNITDVKINKLIDWEKKLFNIQESKDGYYLFRNFYNNKKGQMSKESRTILFFMLANTAINNMVRFNQNGEFNQGYGNRRYDNKIDLLKESIKFCEDKTIISFCEDFKELIKKVDVLKSFFFVDPPYYLRNMPVGWSESDTIYLIDFLLDTKYPFIYTDLKENKHIDKLLNNGCKYIVLNEIANISPNRKQESKYVQIAVYRGVNYEI